MRRNLASKGSEAEILTELILVSYRTSANTTNPRMSLLSYF